MTNGPIAYRSKADLVTEHLRTELQAGRPGPGERIVVDRVAFQLGVSKVPVREAVTRLTGEGLLVHVPNVGPVVPEFSAHEIRETAIMRVAIESAALPTALPRHTDETIATLENLLTEMSGSDVDYPALNVKLHAEILDPTPYRELHRTAHTLLARAQRYAIVHAVPGYRTHANEEHAQLVALVKKRDLDELQRLNHHHITTAADQLIEQVERQQEP
ncbi:GntR family transcriptional regulator [Nocardioidaceae bacterium SCSIO 66511]|nr:GntR family transcriptional regulator [Nocardioidaceae bacterium SCSIO 66511]